MNRTHSTIARLTLGLAATLLLVAPIAHAASLSFGGGSGTVGQTLSVPVLVSAGSSESLNAVSARIDYPTDKLSLLSISKSGSIISFWAEEPSFSNAAGTAYLEGIIPNPGYSGQGGRVATLVFQVKAAGSATVSYGTASVLANDGQGTNILRGASPRTIQLSSGASTPPAPTPAPAPSPTPVTPDEPKRPEPAPPEEPSVPLPDSAFPITSETHPDQDAWYAKATGTFNWDVPEGATGTRLLLSRSATDVPTIMYEPAIQEKTIPDLPEGTSYLLVQHRVAGEWQGTGRYRINIDTEAPEEFTITFPQDSISSDPEPIIRFSASDDESGIERYEVYIDDEKEGAVRYAAATEANPYTLSFEKPGAHVVSVMAYDRAGNRTVAVAGYFLEGIEAPEITYFKEYVTVGEPLTFVGTTHVDSTVILSVYKDGESVLEERVQSNDAGNFSVILAERLNAGSYTATVRAIDSRGSLSPESEPVTVVIEGDVIDWIVTNALTILLLLVLLGTFAFLAVRFRRQLPLLTRRAGTKDLVHRSFTLLKEDIASQIGRLRSEAPKPLTKKEITFLERFESNLEEVQEMVEKKLDSSQG